MKKAAPIVVGPTRLEDDPGAVKIQSGQTKLPELPAVNREISKENQAYIDEFQEAARAICKEPCVIPEEEANADYVLMPEEKAAMEEHAALMKEQKQGSELVRLKRTIIQGNLYVRSILYSDKPADFYMLRVIRNMDDRVSAMPDEFLKASVQTLTVQIHNRDDALKHFSNGMYGAYRKFAEAELRVLIQLRRRFLDEIHKRNF